MTQLISRPEDNIHISGIDFDLLVRDIASLDVEWHQGYANTPRFLIKLKDGIVFNDYTRGVVTDRVKYIMYSQLSLGALGSNIYYTDHPNGLVSYFNHCGDPEVHGKGFGGAPFGVHLPDGTCMVLRGPWSSRATVVNMALEVSKVEGHDICDIVVEEAGSMLRYSTGIKIAALLHLAKTFQFPYYLVELVNAGVERGCVAVSTQPHQIYKPTKDGGDEPNVGMVSSVLYTPDA